MDVRRVWECPACGRRMKRQGEITHYLCHCQEPPVWMHLAEARRANREYQPYIVPEIQADEIPGEEETSPAAVEGPAMANIAAEEAVIEEVVEEVAALVETVEPAKTEKPPVDDDFFSFEEDPDSASPATDPTAPELPEPSRSEQAPETPAAAPPVAETPPQDAPKQGKSRRRSGRKRNRRRGPKGGGG